MISSRFHLGPVCCGPRRRTHQSFSAEFVRIFRSIFVTRLLLLSAVALADPGNGGGNGRDRAAPDGKEKRSERSKDGEYTIAVSGYYKGTGTATVAADSVTINAQVSHERDRTSPCRPAA